MSNSSSAGSGIGFLGVLTISFIVLKLLGYIQWSWIWVLAPTWIPISTVAAVLVVLAIMGFLVWMADRRKINRMF